MLLLVLAVSTAEKAEKLAEAAGKDAMALEIRNHLELFKEGRAYVEEPAGPVGQSSRE